MLLLAPLFMPYAAAATLYCAHEASVLKGFLHAMIALVQYFDIDIIISTSLYCKATCRHEIKTSRCGAQYASKLVLAH